MSIIKRIAAERDAKQPVQRRYGRWLGVEQQARERMPFGVHKGKPLGEVPAQYLAWLREQEWIADWPKVLAYIDANVVELDVELKASQA
jgi:hypothetical protein